MFIVRAMIGGIGIGISTVAASLYISEIAPRHYRGGSRNVQFNIVSHSHRFASNALLPGIGENAWRWMLGWPRFPPSSTRSLPGDPGKPALADWAQGRPCCRSEGLKLIQPERIAGQIESSRCDSAPLRSASALENSGPAVASADPAGLPGGLFQPDVGHHAILYSRRAFLR